MITTIGMSITPSKQVWIYDCSQSAFQDKHLLVCKYWCSPCSMSMTAYQWLHLCLWLNVPLSALTRGTTPAWQTVAGACCSSGLVSAWLPLLPLAPGRESHGDHCWCLHYAPEWHLRESRGDACQHTHPRDWRHVPCDVWSYHSSGSFQSAGNSVISSLGKGTFVSSQVFTRLSQI